MLGLNKKYLRSILILIYSKRKGMLKKNIVKTTFGIEK